MSYFSLFLIWFVFFLLEYFFPRSPKQKFWKKLLLLDSAFALVNVWMFWLIEWNLHDRVEEYFCLDIHFLWITEWNILVQAAFLFVLFDLFRWWTHRGLHYFDWGWKLHKTHHSITEMSFLKVLHYNPLENLVYMVTTLPILLFFHFSWEVFALLAVVDAIFGYHNHANISVKYPKIIQKIFNTPQVHMWHHDESPEKNITGYGKNFGINLSLWDWIFGTLYLPEKNPEKIGNIQDKSFVETKFLGN